MVVCVLLGRALSTFIPLQATKAAASLPDLTKDEADADVAPMDEDYDALEAEAEAELAALAAEAAAAAQGAGSRSEDGGIVMLPVRACSCCIAKLSHGLANSRQFRGACHELTVVGRTTALTLCRLYNVAIGEV